MLNSPPHPPATIYLTFAISTSSSQPENGKAQYRIEDKIISGTSDSQLFTPGGRK